MQKTVLLFLFLGIASVASGSVMTTVYRADGNTPLEPIEVNRPIIKYPDIMVGTKLMIIVSSDVNDNYWPCDLGISGEDRDYGILSARDFNESTGYYDGSLLEAAGDEAFVYFWHDDYLEIDGFSFTGEGDAGDWFIIDYNAIAIGNSKVGFYEWFSFDPAYELSFSHVRTRDFNKDTKVDFADFAALALYWQETNCGDTDDCEGTDIDIDGKVDVNDLILFTDFWLDRIE